jgi:hypothetical protein
MFLFAAFLVLAIIVIVMIVAMVIGGAGMASKGPDPSEGDNSTG